jgi:hypothetical protein
MRGSIREVRKDGFSQRVVFELLVVSKVETDVITDGQSYALPSILFVERPPLGMTLDTRIVRSGGAHLRGIENVAAHGMSHMRAAWAVAAFTAIAGWAGGRCMLSEG